MEEGVAKRNVARNEVYTAVLAAQELQEFTADLQS